MNDLGMFQTINSIIKKDSVLSEKLSEVVTEIRPGLRSPYLVLRFDNLNLDIPCFAQSALIDCWISVHSSYKGDREIHELMSRVNNLLDGRKLEVCIDSMNCSGDGIAKLLNQSQDNTNGVRVGTLKYQVKVYIRRK